MKRPAKPVSEAAAVTTPGPPKDGNAETKPRDLREWYDLGRKVRGRFPDKHAHYDADTIKQLKEELGISKEFLWKAVDCSKRYNRKELEELCRLRSPLAGR